MSRFLGQTLLVSGAAVLGHAALCTLAHLDEIKLGAAVGAAAPGPIAWETLLGGLVLFVGLILARPLEPIALSHQVAKRPLALFSYRRYFSPLGPAGGTISDKQRSD